MTSNHDPRNVWLGWIAVQSGRLTREQTAGCLDEATARGVSLLAIAHAHGLVDEAACRELLRIAEEQVAERMKAAAASEPGDSAPTIHVPAPGQDAPGANPTTNPTVQFPHAGGETPTVQVSGAQVDLDEDDRPTQRFDPSRLRSEPLIPAATPAGDEGFGAGAWDKTVSPSAARAEDEARLKKSRELVKQLERQHPTASFDPTRIGVNLALPSSLLASAESTAAAPSSQAPPAPSAPPPGPAGASPPATGPTPAAGAPSPPGGAPSDARPSLGLPAVQPSAADSRPTTARTVRDLFQEERYRFEHDPRPGRQSALDSRILRPVQLILGSPDDGEGFYREARVMARLDHPGIPKVHDLGRFHSSPFFTLDRIEGRTLEDYIGDPKTWRHLPSLLRTFVAIAATVEHAHERGLLHTAIEPRHVVLGEFGQVWVTDWSTARASETAEPRLREQLGAPPAVAAADPERLAPELRKDPERASERSDVWGLGAVLHVMLTKVLPGKTSAGGDPIETARVEGRRLPRELVAVLRKALGRHPSDRYSSVAKLREEITRYLDGKGVEALQETLWLAALRIARVYPVPAAIAGLAVAALVTIMTFAAGDLFVTLQILRRAEATARRERSAARSAREAAEEARTRIARDVAVVEAAERFDRAVAELTLARARGASDDELAEQHRALISLGAKVGVPLRMDALRRRADWRLGAATKPDPKGALDDYHAINSFDARDPGALLGRLRAAARLPDREGELRSALKSLSGLPTSTEAYSTAGEAFSLIRAAEVDLRGAAADRRAEVREPIESEVRARLAPLPGRLQRAIEQRGAAPIPFLHRLRGRAWLAISGRSRTELKVGDQDVLRSAIDDLVRARMLEPDRPGVDALILDAWVRRWSLHPTWHTLFASLYDGILDDLRHNPRPETLVLPARTLLTGRRPDLARPLIAAMLEDPRLVELPPGLQLMIKMLQHRAAGPEESLAELPADPAAVPDFPRPLWQLIRARERLLAGDLATAEPLLRQGLLDAGLSDPVFALNTLEEMAVDPRLRSADIDALLGRIIEPNRRRIKPQFGRPLIAWRIAIGARLNRDVSALVRELASMGTMSYHDLPARLVLLSDGGRARTPAALHELLSLWASVNLGQRHEEPQVYGAQRRLVERLQAAGRRRQALELGGVDPVSELAPPKAWMRGPLRRWERGQDRLESLPEPEGWRR